MAQLAQERDYIEVQRSHGKSHVCDKHARAALETAGVTVDSESSEILLTPMQEGFVSLVLREAVTNVVRHAHARRCSLRVGLVNGSCRVEIYDDGRGGGFEGNGLRGMRERI